MASPISKTLDRIYCNSHLYKRLYPSIQPPTQKAFVKIMEISDFHLFVCLFVSSFASWGRIAVTTGL